MPTYQKLPKNKTITQEVYEKLRQDILQGQLPPNGKLKILDLQNNYATGMTPIREALNRLSTSGLVVQEGKRGFKVAPISQEDLLDITELRITLERQALENSIKNGDDDWESRVVAAFYQLEKLNGYADEQASERWEKYNHSFHEALLSACTSKWLIRFYEIIYDQHKRYRNISLAADHKRRKVDAEHRRIYDAALARDINLACNEIENHIRLTASRNIEVFNAIS
jgi:DNA-binding GntR family transcriptional regulator